MKDRQSIDFPFAIDPFSFIDQNPGCISLINSNSENGEYLIGWGVKHEICLFEVEGAFDKLKAFRGEHKDWMMGYLSYDLKNDLEDLHSKNSDELAFPELHFFVPLLVISIDKENTNVLMDNAFSKERLYSMMDNARSAYKIESKEGRAPIFHGIEENEYLKHFDSLSAHIQQGDIYEVNYCLEFKASAISIDPIATYYRLNKQTEAPFSVYYNNKEHYLLCGSPERYLKKEGGHLLSQPIKGTSKRGTNTEEDELLKKRLAEDPKERAENVMIVDLVRNDLSRIAKKSSVKVEELFGVYSFKTVHQLISSISCDVDSEMDPVDIIEASFPMGSMTGAPKISAMKIIEEHEDFKRGIYSGAFGYFKPNGDFDFNVVIRSILYNEKKKMVSFPVGGAITSLANAKNEYHECILKAKAMKNALQNN